MAETQKVTRRYTVIGRVQGVGFRWFVEHAAASIGVVGWVRNRANGDVEVLACGTSAELQKLYEQLLRGPRAARVDRVEVEDAAPAADLNSFQIEGTW